MRRFLRRSHVIFGLVAILALVAAFGANSVATKSAQEPRQIASIGGIERQHSLAELAAMSDVIVVGTAASSRVVPFTQNAEVPPADRDARIWAKASYRDLSFSVREYLKGSGSAQISIRSHASTKDFEFVGDTLPEPAVGSAYVIFLERGRGVWTGGFTVLGSRGFGQLTDTSVRFNGFGEVPLSTLRDTAARNAQPPRRR